MPQVRFPESTEGCPMYVLQDKSARKRWVFSMDQTDLLCFTLASGTQAKKYWCKKRPFEFFVLQILRLFCSRSGSEWSGSFSLCRGCRQQLISQRNYFWPFVFVRVLHYKSFNDAGLINFKNFLRYCLGHRWSCFRPSQILKVTWKFFLKAIL